jgi:UDP-N-acetylmuramyl pentapeptide phosphotransferase/UDP-N-acetylglucosamine-1-phosphate transferase
VPSNVVTMSILAVLTVSFVACSLLVLTQRWHGTLTLDHDLSGAQKIHHAPVPRIGGIGVLAGLLVGVALGYVYGGSTWPYAAKLLLCASPVFAAGLIEDLTKRVSIRTRLLASFASAAFAIWIMEASLTRLDIFPLDNLPGWSPILLIFTCFAVGGLTNAINIIDGLNGLASGAVALMLAGLAGIAWLAGDLVVTKLCLWGIAGLVGFMLLNYPFGRIFLGDCGAYLAGFWLAECAVLLLHRSPEVSTWSVLLCVAYPTWETVYSMYRRNVKQRVSYGQADMVHLHHLVLRTVAQALGVKSRHWLRHGAATFFVWIIIALCQFGALLAWNNHVTAFLLMLAFVVAYVRIYTSFGQRHQAKPADVGMQPGKTGA